MRLMASCLLGLLLPVLMGQTQDASPHRTIALHDFKTTSPPPRYRPPEKLRGVYKRFRPMLNATPERLLVDVGLQAGLTHDNITEAQRDAVRPKLNQLYDRIALDPAWRDVTSCLPFCFDNQPDRMGRYLMVAPNEADAATPVVVFLHGYGGLFQSQVELFRMHLPEVIILAPAWRETWRDGSAKYIDDMLADAEDRLGFAPAKPTLIGLSDGAKAAFRIMGSRPGTYERMVSLAMSPRQALVNRMPRDLPVLMINGDADQRVHIKTARQRARSLERRLKAFTFKEVKGDHFFLLMDPASSFAAIRAFLGLDP